MKKLLLLGGSLNLIPVIKTAHKLGCYVITCDYLPNNIAHKYSDQYCNISIIDKNAVLDQARELNIDGIMSFASDPGVVTAAFVAEKLSLPFQGSFKSVSILQDKGMFRKFLKEHHFNVPDAKRYTDKEEPYKDMNFFKWPVIVKPVDSAGSKGVAKAENPDELKKAVESALECSFRKSYIIEDFLNFKGCHSSADVFTENGEIRFIIFSDQLFDKEAENCFVPTQIIWPSTMETEHQKYLTSEIQRLMKLLKMGTGIYNIETCVGVDGKPYIMEVSPRGGGCNISEVQKRAFGVDLIEAEIRSAFGIPVSDVKQVNNSDGYWCEYVIHSRYQKSGLFKELIILPEIREKYMKGLDLTVKKGDMVYPFTGANRALGDIQLRFDSRDELDRVMSDPFQWMEIVLEDD